MSSLLSHYFLPGAGVATLALGLGIGFANRDYGQEKIASLETRVERVEARATAQSEKASAEAARAAELEEKVAAVQAAATEQAASAISLTAPAPTNPDGSYGLGRPAVAEEIAAWDVDILPDGRGLPPGSGDVYTGEEVFADKCASCHGDFAEGVDNWPVLAGGFDTLGDKDPVKTVGSYWPHLSTAWDYIHRSMPFGEAGTLTADETYAIVAYILYSNDVVDDDFELSDQNFNEVQMHNSEGFVLDDRPELEYSAWRAEPCMSDCKPEARIAMRSVFLVETPEEGGSESVMNDGKADELPTFTAAGPSFVPVAAPVAATVVAAASEPEAPAAEPAEDGGAELIAAGEKVFKKCKACHAVGAGAKNKSGPLLTGVIGREMGAVEGFKYSAAFKAAREEGRVWDTASMDEFIAKPKAYIKGTKMAFSGLRKAKDREALLAYLASFAEE